MQKEQKSTLKGAGKVRDKYLEYTRKVFRKYLQSIEKVLGVLAKALDI